MLILDEPTSSLDINEANRLFEVMRKLKSEGIGIIFITHFLDQVYEVSDRITVLRNGKLVGAYDTATLPRIELIARMLGRSLTDLIKVSKAKAEEPELVHPRLVETKGLGRKGELEPTDLVLNGGEVVGLAGLLGSGRTELAGLIFGIETPDTGALLINDKPVERFSPFQSLQHGVGLCPEDRKAEGIVGDLTIRENIILALQAHYGWFKYLNTQQQNEIALKYIELLDIATPSPEQLVKNLSGGNQQKVILARWLATDPQVLILDEPTRGIDVGAKAEIQKLVLDLAEEGKSILFISSELDEVMRISDRIVVLRDQKKAAEYPRRRQRSGHHADHGRNLMKKEPLLTRIRESRLLWPLVALGLIFLFDAIFEPQFFRIGILNGHLFGNLIDVLNDGAPLMLVAIGMTMVIATGGVDLSVGAVIAISAAIATVLINPALGKVLITNDILTRDATNTPLPIIVIVCLVAGTLCGLWNGMLVSRAKIPPMIATLILMVAGRGIAQLITNGQIMTIYYTPYFWFGNGFILGLPVSIYIVALVSDAGLGGGAENRGGAVRRIGRHQRALHLLQRHQRKERQAAGLHLFGLLRRRRRPDPQFLRPQHRRQQHRPGL